MNDKMRVFTNAIRRRSKLCTTVSLSTSGNTATGEKRKRESDDETNAKRRSALRPQSRALWTQALTLNDQFMLNPAFETIMLNPKMFDQLRNSLTCQMKIIKDDFDLQLRFSTTYFLSSILRQLNAWFYKRECSLDEVHELATSTKQEIRLALPIIDVAVPKVIDQQKLKNSQLRQRNLPPNYFVAVQVKNHKIMQNLNNVQECLVKSNRRLEAALVSLTKSHITLMVMHLDEEHCLHDATKALRKTVEKLKEIRFAPLLLTFEGVGHFKNAVVFAKVKNDAANERLKLLAETVHNSFMECDIASTDNIAKSFTAHLTIAKLSKDPGLWKRGVKKIMPDQYHQHTNMVFGVEEIKSIQLLSMYKTSDSSGYYHCVEEIPF